MLTFKDSFVVCVILNKVKNLNAQTRCIQILRLLRMTLLIDSYFLVDDFETAVRNQCLRNADAFRCLMVFE